MNNEQLREELDVHRLDVGFDGEWWWALRAWSCWETCFLSMVLVRLLRLSPFFVIVRPMMSFIKNTEFPTKNPRGAFSKALFQEDAKHVATTDAQPDPVQETRTSAVWIHRQGTHRGDGAVGVAAQDVSFAVLATSQGAPPRCAWNWGGSTRKLKWGKMMQNDDHHHRLIIVIGGYPFFRQTQICIKSVWMWRTRWVWI